MRIELGSRTMETHKNIKRIFDHVTRNALARNTGKQLDLTGARFALRRARGPWYWPFKESDKRFRARILETITKAGQDD